MSKHTPGPWIVGKPSVAHEVQIFADGGGSCLQAGLQVICTMPAKGKGRTANARLIIKSPELLLQCKCLLADLESALPRLLRASGMVTPDESLWAVSIKEAKALIAEIEGA